MISKAKKVDKENFGKFGSVVKLSSKAPTSSDATYKFWSNLADYKINGRTEIGLCTVYKQAINEISCVERHLSTPEILIPVDAPFILPLLLEGEPESNLESFIVKIGEAVVINDGVWHGACLPVGKNESSYFVIFKLDTPSSDVEKKNIQPVQIEF
jgi:ureidoglycolate hydrolase